jgi:peptidoglycan/xylan/chitin deacetylase (PgdA/CDA1 family)
VTPLFPVHNRYPYSAIHTRPDYDWPGGKRLAFSFVINLEYYAFNRGVSPDNAIDNAPPTQRNYAWRDYGNRVGFWRLVDLFDQLGLPAAFCVNTLLYQYQPELFTPIRARRDEVIAHGRTNSETQQGLWPADELRMLQECRAEIMRNEGTPPQGWKGTGIGENADTPELLRSAGYSYTLDWPCDDQPVWLKTREGRLLAIPYSFEINDTVVAVRQRHSAREFADMLVDQFEEMAEQSQSRPLACCIALHPYVVGQPFRLRPLRKALQHCLEHPLRERVWFTRPGEVARHCESLPPGVVPGSE